MVLNEKKKRGIECQFDCYIKKSLAGAIKNYQHNQAKKKNAELLVDDFPDIKYFDYYECELNKLVFQNMVYLIENDELFKALNSLPEDKKKIIILFYFLELSDVEIAELLDKVRRTVNYARHKALEELKFKIAGGEKNGKI